MNIFIKTFSPPSKSRWAPKENSKAKKLFVEKKKRRQKREGKKSRREKKRKSLTAKYGSVFESEFLRLVLLCACLDGAILNNKEG
jgi:hypothetical protein